MPGSGTAAVKCEPLSDEEDSSPQLPDLFLHNTSPEVLEELAPLAPAGPAATPVCIKQEPADTALNLEILESAPHSTGSILERHMAILRSPEEPNSANFTPLRTVKDEPSSEEQQQHSSDDLSDSCGLAEPSTRGSPKTWRQQDMDNALDALRNHNMSLTKASSTYGIPSTTLWQRAHRLGIDTPKKEGAAKSWSEADLRGALHALRAGAISANKASKAYGIPSSTLYKIARREGIRLAAPFNAAPVAWRRGDLARALAAIRAGRASVQRAAAQYGIPTGAARISPLGLAIARILQPFEIVSTGTEYRGLTTGTLYGRCKREGIELSRSNPTPWSEDAMGEALDAVRIGQMSINQAAIHFNLPYSSLYGRFKRCKYQTQSISQQEVQNPPELVHNQELSYYHQMPMYAEQEHALQHQYPHNEFVADTPPYNNMILHEPYSGQTMYYNQNFSSIATS